VLGKRSNNSRRVLAGDLDEHREAGIALDVNVTPLRHDCNAVTKS